MTDQRRAKKVKEQSAARGKGTISFELNPYYEQLLEMREKKPGAYRVMSSATRLALDAYEKAKEAASGQIRARAA
jgi:hypothetical protein